MTPALGGKSPPPRCGRLAVLVVGPGYPWAMGQGVPARVGGILRALSGRCKLGYLGVGPFPGRSADPPDAIVLDVCAGADVVPRRVGRGEWLAWSVGSMFGASRTKPQSRRMATSLRAELPLHDFDVIWVTTADLFELLEDSLRGFHGKVVVDFVDWPGERPPDVGCRLGDAQRGDRIHTALRELRRARAVMLEGRRASLISERVDAVVASKVPPGAHPRLQLVVNSYPARPFRGARPASDVPVILFQATYGYPPNVEAAHFLVRDVVPRLRQVLPHGFEVRLVGRGEGSIRHLADAPEVTVTGYVERIEDELERADLCVVPLLRGTGTRVKILEAWAFGVPVVSTAVGADGLDAKDSVHLLIADGPADFAQASLRALRDQALRDRVAAAGSRLLAERFSVRSVQHQVDDVLAFCHW